MYLSRLINSTGGRYIISILLGLGLATLFRKACSARNCLAFKAPPISTIDGKIFNYDGRCYRYDAHAGPCRQDRDTVSFA